MSEYSIGVDLGGTNLRAAAISIEGKILDKISRDTRLSAGGHVGNAADLGHLTVIPNGNPCGRGNYGCVEKHASATAITAMAQMLSLGDNLTSEDVFKLASGGNEKAKMIFKHMGTALGIALA